MITRHVLAYATIMLSLSTLILQPTTALAQGTAFTYQGRLDDNGVPATGLYNLVFIVCDAATGGNAVGMNTSVYDFPVTNGLFTVQVDPGANVFTGPPRWLEIRAVSSLIGGNPVTLAPRQPLTPAPYAFGALTVSSTALAGVYGGAVSFPNARTLS